MFVTVDGALLVNEIAPRPHNSGHYTIDACVTSQFEQQARVLAGLPLGGTRQHAPAVMVNLLGDVWFADPEAATPREPDWTRVLRHPQAKLHLYGKAEARRGRKMGHVTCLGADARRGARDRARDQARSRHSRRRRAVVRVRPRRPSARRRAAGETRGGAARTLSAGQRVFARAPTGSVATRAYSGSSKRQPAAT